MFGRTVEEIAKTENKAPGRSDALILPIADNTIQTEFETPCGERAGRLCGPN
jgi:hypothetical protein